MKMTVKLNHLRIAPRKVRLIADVIRNKKVEEAQAILNFSVKKGSLPLLKLLNSAVSNASSVFQSSPDNLYISKIVVDEGRKLKRWRPRARGVAGKIQKKTSSIILVLEEIKSEKKGKKTGAKKEKVTLKKAVESKTVREEEKTSEKQPNYFKKFQDDGKIGGKQKNIGGTNKIFRRKSI